MSLQLRLALEHTTPFEFKASSSEEFALNLQLAECLSTACPAAFKNTQVYLHYGGQWWDLIANLKSYCWWLVETGRSTADEVRLFSQAPLENPVWLFEAAMQMNRLLSATTALTKPH